MFRSSTIIRELALNLAKVIFMLKHSVKLHRYMLFGDVTECHRAACVPFFSRPQHSTAVFRRPCYAVALRRTAWSEHGMGMVWQV